MQWGREDYLMNGWRVIGRQQGKKIKLNAYLRAQTKINSRWIRWLNNKNQTRRENNLEATESVKALSEG